MTEVLDIAEQEYVPVAAETICEGTSPDFDIYLHHSADKYVLFLARGAKMLPQQKARLKSSGKRVLYLKAENQAEYYRYVSDNMHMMLEDPLTSSDRKAAIVYNTASHLMLDVLENPDTEANVRRATEVAKNTVSMVTSAENIESILGMTNFDYNTHTHSVNVCVYGLALAKRLGFTDEKALSELSVGLLLHDVGKSQVNQKILNKPGRLTPEEFEHIKTHTTLAQNVLSQRTFVPEMTTIIATQHHEKFSGEGYPKGLAGEKIHPMARLAAIVDVFDALTTRRPYKDPMPSFEALKIMKNDTGHHDDKMLMEFIRMLATK